MINLDKFFKPKSVVIVGASRNPNKIGHVILRSLMDSEYNGKIHLVNRDAKKILNFKCYKSVSSIKSKVELAIIAVPAEYVIPVIKECNKKKIKDVLVISAGFSETGNVKLEEELKNYLIENKMRMLGVNCLGVLDTYSNMDSIFLPRYRLKRPEAGGISFVCQSGAVGSTILDLASDRGNKFSKFISYGNATTIDETDIIEYLGKDKKTKVICFYVESIKDGRKFLKVVKKVSKKKPIIAIKGGMTKAGESATLSHTGSLAGNAAVYLGVFKQVGIISVDNLNDMLNIASLFEKSIKPKGNRVQVMTNGGGYGILSIDAIDKNKNLDYAKLSEKTTKYLKKIFPKIATVGNPMDLVGDATNERYKEAIYSCLKDKNIDILLVIALFQTPLITANLVEIISEANLLKKKPIFVVSSGGKFTNVLRRALEDNGVMTFTFPSEAVDAISGFVEYYQ